MLYSRQEQREDIEILGGDKEMDKPTKRGERELWAIEKTERHG